MDNKYLLKVLAHLEIFDNIGIEKERLIEDILFDCKMLRKSIKAINYKEKGINIYKNKGVCIDDIIDFAFQQEYIENSLIYKNYYSLVNNPIKISAKGLDFLKSCYTNDYCNEYLKFKDQVDTKIKLAGEPRIKELIVMKYFYEKRSVNELLKFWDYEKTGLCYIDKVKYQEHIFDLLDQKISTDDYIFNFKPMLFVPKEFIGSKVSCSIEGININQEIKVYRPFPNKRYYICGFNIDGEDIANGFYPIIAPKEQFPEELNITINWRIINTFDNVIQDLKIKHLLKINFNFDEIGKLFSTENSLYNYDIPSFNLGTCLDKYIFDKNRTKEINYLSEDNIVISEEATLNCFMLRNASIDGYYFDRWCNNQIKNNMCG